jgi:hypothetical protein
VAVEAAGMCNRVSMMVSTRVRTMPVAPSSVMEIIVVMIIAVPRRIAVRRIAISGIAVIMASVEASAQAQRCDQKRADDDSFDSHCVNAPAGEENDGRSGGSCDTCVLTTADLHSGRGPASLCDW